MTKQSSTRQSQPEHSWTFFTDRDLGNTIPDALKATGYSVVRHDDHFREQNTQDTEWMPAVANEGWIALSHNKRIGTIAIERDVAMRAGLALFFLIGKMKHEDLAVNLIATIPRVIRFREKYNPPFIAKIHRPDTKFILGSRPGAVEMYLTESQWRASLADGD